MIACSVAGEMLMLLPERAVYWPAGKALFVADFHLGKAASFRRAGIPLPSGTTTENVNRLDRAIEKTAATSVVFLGDFLHSAQGRAPRTFERFAAWRESRASVDLTIVRGNHDVKAGDPPEAWGEKSLRLPCFWFGSRYGVLPAFGAFTGNAEVLPRRGDRGFVVAEHEVLQVA